MRIDAHQHFWRFDPTRDQWITDSMASLKRDFLPPELIAELKRNDFDGSIAVQADQSEQETLFLLDLADHYPEIKGVVGWVDLLAPNVGERLAYFSHFSKLVGFRHIAQSEPDDGFLARAAFFRGIRELAAFHFTYDILIYPRQLLAAAELVEKFPEQRFVLDHLSKPPVKTGQIEEWARRMRSIAAHPNLYLKLSGLVTEADWRLWRESDFRPYLDLVFEAFPTDRLMFGSDWPVCLLAASYRQVKNLIASYIRHLPLEQQQRIFGANATSFYRLPVPDHEFQPQG
jgi:L-fuconolactonase